MRNCLALFGVLLALWMTASAYAETIVLAVPGPGSISYLPVYLAKAIKADKTEGLDLKLRYFNGGPAATRDLMSNNSDFLAIGLPSIADSRSDNMPIVAIGQLSQSAMYVFLLRSELKDQVQNIAQLKGRRIGTTSSTSSQRSMGHMMTEYLIRRAGLKPSDVQIIPTGQSRETQSAALASAIVDATMGDEPFASELVAKGVAVRLADLYTPRQSNELLGGPIVHAALATREDVYTNHPKTVEKVIRMFDRTLRWMSEHSAIEITDKLTGQPGFNAANSKLLADILQRNRGMFPSSIGWDAQAVATTETFFRSVAISATESHMPFAVFIRNMPGSKSH